MSCPGAFERAAGSFYRWKDLGGGNYVLKTGKTWRKEIPEKILSEDRKHCKKIGPCGIGKEALYLNSFYLERRYYVPVSSVSRVFKRVAMSKGGFTGKGLFATMPYLVVVLDDGSEKQCNFKYEDQVDAFVSAVKERFPQVKTVSEAAEKRLAEAEKKEAQKRLIPLSEQAKESVGILEQAKEKLSKRMSLFTELTNAAKKKRTYEKTKPFYKWLALFMVIMGAAALGYGVYSFMNHDTFAVYFVLFGMAAIFLFSGANVMRQAQITGKPSKNGLHQPRRRSSPMWTVSIWDFRSRPAIFIP